MEENKEQIYTAINAIMADMEAIGKTKKNPQQGYNFRGVDDVMNTLKPLLTKHGVFVVPRVKDQKREVKQSARGSELIYSILTVDYQFFARDGSSITASVIGEGMDSGDKASNKAMSVAFKYAAFQVFCIPTEEMIDPDMETHQLKPAKKAEPARTTSKAEEVRPSEEQLRALVQIATEHDLTDYVQGQIRAFGKQKGRDLSVEEYKDLMQKLDTRIKE